MSCIKCGEEKSRVLNSRPQESQLFPGLITCIKRQRECLSCKYRWNTYECPEKKYENGNSET